MGYVLRHGKLVRREKLRRREPEREPINMGYQHELWKPGPVRIMARALARQEFIRDCINKKIDLRDVTERQIELGVTRILFNTGEIYLAKAKEALR